MATIRLRRRLVLASQSPRRRALLESHGYDFVTIAPSANAECGICSREAPPQMVGRLARQKAQSVVQRLHRQAGFAAPDHDGNGDGEIVPIQSAEPTVVIGCDTVASCHGHMLGKPVDRRHARQMLQQLNGRRHQVYSGLCVWALPEDDFQIRVAVSSLQMDPLPDEAIEQYLDSDQWQGKAGAFGYQDGWDWLTLIDGSESNVVGLPMELLSDMLSRWTQGDSCQGQAGTVS